MLSSLDDKLIHNLDFDELEIGFLYSPTRFEAGEAGRRVVITYCPAKGEVDEIRAHLDKAFSCPPDQNDTVVFEDVLKTVLLQVQHLAGEDKRRFLKATCSGRASIALCVATWVALTWQTEWFDSLCSCVIMQTTTERNQKVAAIKPGSPLPLETGCSTVAFPRRPYLHLGILLAELALARPIRVDNESGELTFYLQEPQPNQTAATRNPGTRQEAVNLLVLLKRIAKETSDLYKAAAAYCFVRDADTQRKRSDGDSPELRVEDFKSCIERLIYPIQVHHKALEEHKRSQQQLYSELEAIVARRTVS